MTDDQQIAKELAIAWLGEDEDEEGRFADHRRRFTDELCRVITDARLEAMLEGMRMGLRHAMTVIDNAVAAEEERHVA